MALVAGDKLGPYEILAPIGAGGMGEVYRAKDTKLKRDVALKVLPKPSPSTWNVWPYMVGFHLVDGAGHWVQQEQPERVSELLLQFLRDSAKR
jgi:serine/threonine protein kinase